MARQALTIADLSHKVVLCAMQDVVLADGTMSLAREKVTERWAQIIQSTGSFYSKQGQAVNTVHDPREVRTHKIVIRYDASLEISATAWIYERRLKSAPRWFKVLSVFDDNENWYTFDARQVERSDLAAPPVAKVESCDPPAAFGGVPMPHGVKL